MAPELKKRTRSASAPAAKQAAPKPKAAPASKRKAADHDSSPVQKKKTKPSKEAQPAKAAPKPKSKAAKPAPKSSDDEDENQALVPANDDDDEDPFSDEESNDEDQAKALAAAVDSDNEDKDEAPDAAVVYKKGQDVGKVPSASKKASKAPSGETGVVYVGRIPHGFYEHEMKQYFSQFGTIQRLRLSRNKKTGRSKHFAFIEFAEKGVAEIVQKTMDNYLLFGHILKCKMVPRESVHEGLWKGANRRYKSVPHAKLAAGALKKPLTESGWQGKIGREQRRRSARAQKLAAAGIDYDFDAPALKAADATAPALEAPAEEEAPKAIEAPPAAETAAVEEELAVKKPTPTKAGKKGKKGKKTKA